MYTTFRILGAIRLPFNIQSSKRDLAGFTTSSNFIDTADWSTAILNNLQKEKEKRNIYTCISTGA